MKISKRQLRKIISENIGFSPMKSRATPEIQRLVSNQQRIAQLQQEERKVLQPHESGYAEAVHALEEDLAEALTRAWDAGLIEDDFEDAWTYAKDILETRK
tara:strand:- start:281 stop:583 length:303 start_codon:yes stop_codon:yes gene_type:complete